MRTALIRRLACLTAVALSAAPALRARMLPPAVQSAPNATQPQARKPASGFVMGQVLDAATNRPIPNAVVALSAAAPVAGAALPESFGGPSSTRRVLTDDQGRFLFRDLGKGALLFSATASGYLDGGYGQRRPGGQTQPFTLEEDQRVGDMTIRLSKAATLGGTVTDEAGGPVVGVSVWLARRESGSGTPGALQADYRSAARTDDRGTYQVTGLLPGDYFVSVPTRMTAMPISLVDAAAPVLDSLRASGSYAMSMGMGGMSPGVRLGEFVIQTTEQGNLGGSNAFTSRLPTTMLPDGRIRAYPTTFYSSATAMSESTAITLRTGEERSDIDLQLRPVAMVRVSGTVIGPNGPEPNFAVHLIPAYASGQSLERTHEAAVTASDAKGAFTFLAVAPGQYVLKAWNLPQLLVIGSDPMPPDATRWGETPVSIGSAPVAGVALNLRPGATLSGRLEFDGSAPVPRPQQLQTVLSVAVEPAWPLALGARFGTRVAADNTFITQGVPPGKHFLKLPNQFSMPGWFFESATLDGKDLMTSPLTIETQSISGIVIRFSDRRTDLAGSVQDASGKPATNAMVLIFPADYRAWIQAGMSALAARIVQASQTGTYSATGLRPGEYLVAAASEEFLADWQQASKIEALAPFAERVTLVRGEVKRQDLKARR